MGKVTVEQRPNIEKESLLESEHFGEVDKQCVRALRWEQALCVKISCVYSLVKNKRVVGEKG